MALDRIVTFKEAVPPREDIGKALEDYLGGVLAEPLRWDERGKRYFAVIKGAGSHPFRRLIERPFSEENERWIEVVIDDDSIDVLTRHQDELVNNIAEGFAVLVARFWKGAKSS